MDHKFLKDPETGAVINADSAEIKAAKERKEKKLREKERQHSLEQEVAMLKDDIGEIKNLLRQVLNGTNNS